MVAHLFPRSKSRSFKKDFSFQFQLVWHAEKDKIMGNYSTTGWGIKKIIPRVIEQETK